MMLSANLFTSLAILCLAVGGGSFPQNPQEQQDAAMHTVTVSEDAPTISMEASTVYSTRSSSGSDSSTQSEKSTSDISSTKSEKLTSDINSTHSKSPTSSTFNSTHSGSKHASYHSFSHTTHPTTSLSTTLSSSLTPTRSSPPKHTSTSTANGTSEDAETTCSSKWRWYYETFRVHGKGWDAKKLNKGGPGQELKKQIKGCGVLTGWSFKVGDEVGEFNAKGHLPVFLKKCLERALVSAGSPKVKCHGGV